jgi:hypothetical protein
MCWHPPRKNELSDLLGIMQAKHNVRWPQLIGNPVLDSIRPVIERSRDVQTNISKIAEVAGWMAYEELPMPDYALPFNIAAGDTNETIDFILTAACIDTAFTDFSTHVTFRRNTPAKPGQTRTPCSRV